MKNKMLEFIKIKKEIGITITEIIEQSGIGRTSFYEIMKGEQIPKLNTAFSIAKALGTNIKELFPELDDSEIEEELK